MKIVEMGIKGKIYRAEDLNSLILREINPDPEAKDIIYLRLAFVTRGTGGNIFPSFILDDWGREINGFKLYDWMRQNGEHFPRGEIFGYEEDGRVTQCFIRELELYARLPLYAYEKANQPVTEGILINTVGLPDELAINPIQITKPQGFKYPLRAALVNWWRIPKEGRFETFDLNHTELDPGY